MGSPKPLLTENYGKIRIFKPMSKGFSFEDDFFFHFLNPLIIIGKSLI